MWSEVQAEAGRAARRVTEVFQRKQVAYRHMFVGADGKLTRAGEIVLNDLMKFCRQYQTTAQFSPVTGQIDPLASAKADGRREVLLHMLRYIKLDPAAAYAVAHQE